MPQRFLRPGLTTSTRFNSAGWQAQSLYVRLITLVDDYGRFESHPMLLKSLAFPFNPEITCEQMLWLCEELQTNDLAVFYEVGGKGYLQLSRWQEKARSHSKFPEFNGGACKQLLANVSKCSAPSSSSSSSPSSSLVAASVPNGTEVSLTPGAKKIRLATKEDIAELEKDPSLKGINMHQEYAAMVRWCDSNRKKPTRRRFINWINLSASKLKYRDTSKAQPNQAPTVWTLTKAIEAKQDIANALKARHAVETGLDTTWNNEAKRAEFYALRKEIKELKTKLAGMA